MVLHYYFDLMSQPCRAVYIFLKMTSIPFVSKPIALRNRQHMTEEYAKINPFMKVPAIDDDGFLLTESVAIMNYLADKHEKNQLYPKDPKERARVDEYLHWQHLNLRMTGSMVFQSKIIIPQMTKKPVDQKALEKWIKKWHESSEAIENVWLKRSPFLAGSRLTIADLSAVCEMMQPIAGGFDLDRSRFSKLHQWIENVKKQSQPFFDEAHSFPMKLRQKILDEEKKSK